MQSSRRLVWLSVALISGALLSVLNIIALAEYWYWYFTWFDTFMHFLGGVVIGSFVGALFLRERVKWFWLLALGAFIAWELFEYFFGIPREKNYAFDTTIDLIADCLGAGLVFILMRRTLWK